jgi:hypothetical protein
MAPPSPSLAPRLRGPFPWIGAILSLAWIIFACLALSDLMGKWTLAAWVGAWLWILSWGVRLTAYRQKVMRGRVTGPRCAWKYWTLEPAVLLVMTALSWSGLLLRWRFSLSSRQLEAYAHEVASGKRGAVDVAGEPPRVGLFSILRSGKTLDGTVYLETEVFLFGHGGFALVSDPARIPSRAKFSYQHLTGPWWIWAAGSKGVVRLDE